MALDTTKTAHEIINSGRSTGQTVIDSDGNLKWAMENLYRNGAGGVQAITVVSGVDYTIRAASGSIAYSGAATGTLDASAGVSRIEVTASTTTLTITPTDATEIAVYRSDLAGMQFDKFGSDYLPNETAGALYGPGIDYSTGRGGLQVYETRTNLNTYFEVSQTNWIPTNTAILEDQSLNALGVFNGCKVTRGASTFNQAARNPNTMALTSGAAYTMTFLWSDTTTTGLFIVADETGIASGLCSLTTAGVFTQFGSLTGVCTLLAHRDLGGGLYRSSIKWVPDFTGNGTYGAGPLYGVEGDSVILYASQFEAGSSASPLIPTYGSTVTRAFDNMTTLVSSFGYNVNAGTVVCDFVSFDEDTSGEQNVFNFGDGTTSNRAISRRLGTTSVMFVVSGGETVANFAASGLSVGVASKVAMGIEANNFAQSLDGAAVVSDTDGAMPSGITELRYGWAIINPSTSELNGLIYSLAYYPFRATDAQLVEASS